MAEFLIYNVDHWSVNAPQKVKDSWTSEQIAKFQTVYEQGDIVEVREDGYWSVNHGWNHNVFGLLKVPNVIISTVSSLAEVYKSGRTLLKKRRYKVNIDFSVQKEQTFGNMGLVTITDKSTT